MGSLAGTLSPKLASFPVHDLHPRVREKVLFALGQMVDYRHQFCNACARKFEKSLWSHPIYPTFCPPRRKSLHSEDLHTLYGSNHLARELAKACSSPSVCSGAELEHQLGWLGLTKFSPCGAQRHAKSDWHFCNVDLCNEIVLKLSCHKLLDWFFGWQIGPQNKPIPSPITTRLIWWPQVHTPKNGTNKQLGSIPCKSMFAGPWQLIQKRIIMFFGKYPCRVRSFCVLWTWAITSFAVASFATKVGHST